MLHQFIFWLYQKKVVPLHRISKPIFVNNNVSFKMTSKMKKLMYVLTIMMVAMLIRSCEPLPPEQVLSSIYGVVTDAETGEPIPHSYINWYPHSEHTICMPQYVSPAPILTDSLGRYTISLYVGTCYISAEADGYEGTRTMIIEVQDENPVEMNFQLTKAILE